MKVYGTKEELITELLKLEVGKVYSMEIKEPKSKRTLNQNNYMWKLIHEIAKIQQEDEMDIYCLALEEADAKYEFLMGKETILDELRKNFRAVRVVRPIIKNKEKFLVYKCFIGSSKFDKKEMAKLLEIVIRWAEELDINTSLLEPIWSD